MVDDVVSVTVSTRSVAVVPVFVLVAAAFLVVLGFLAVAVIRLFHHRVWALVRLVRPRVLTAPRVTSLVSLLPQFSRLHLVLLSPLLLRLRTRRTRFQGGVIFLTFSRYAS